MPARLSVRALIPVAMVITAGFGVYYLYWGIVALQRGNMSFALFYGLYGLGGIVLSLSLRRLWRQLKRPDA